MKNKPMATRIKRELSPEFIFGMNPSIEAETKTVSAEPVIYDANGKKEIVDHQAWLSDVDQFNKMFSEV